MQRPDELENLRRVAVFGMGKSGVAAVKLLRRTGLETHAVNEGPVESWISRDGLGEVLSPMHCHSQENAASVFEDCDLVILSPGIPLTHEVLVLARARGVKIASEIELAWWFTRKIPLIAITGTNGKTTTTTMISESLKLAGKRVFCGGNIGIPYAQMALEACEGVNYDFAIIEVSSFQLETIHSFRPSIALILNLTPNHSERYESLEDYGRAKFQILRNMRVSDHVILGEEANLIVGWAQSHPARKHLFSKERLPEGFLREFDFTQGVLVGGHNRANFFCAWKVLEILGIPGLHELFQRFIASFAGVEHRLEFVGEFAGLKVYNDAKSTNAEATRTALAAFEDNDDPLYLVVGGKLRNQSDHLLPDLVPFKGRVTEIFTMGETTARLQQELGHDFKVEAVHDLDGLAILLRERRLQGNLVFSPAHPSYDQFKNYGERGVTFKRKVREALG